MSEKINILFHNRDNAGVNYYRTVQPALKLQELFPDDFYVEINDKIDWNDFNYLSKFHIIHGHKSFVSSNDMPGFAEKLRKLGVVTILDFDDYFTVHKEHPMYYQFKVNHNIKDTFKIIKSVDYVTTTTPVFADMIKNNLNLTKNVQVLENGVDPENNKQFRQTEKFDNGFLKILWLGGSSHYSDLKLLENSFKKLHHDKEIEDKYQLHIAGFDLRGSITNYEANEQLAKELQGRGINPQKIYKRLQQYNFDIDKIDAIPNDIKDKYRGNVISKQERKIQPSETVWYKYEKEIFTDDFSLIKDKDYVDFLHKFKLDEKYPNMFYEQPYIRHKTKGVNSFANNYYYGDVALAPIKIFSKKNKKPIPYTDDNMYQLAKSNLKLVEAGINKTPVIASNIPIYNYDTRFKHGENVFFVNPDRQYRDDWFKYMKKCIQNPDMVKEMGESAYDVVYNNYHLDVITKKRADFYKEIAIKNNNQI